jgi:hypothetical protein
MYNFTCVHVSHWSRLAAGSPIAGGGAAMQKTLCDPAWLHRHYPSMSLLPEEEQQISSPPPSPSPGEANDPDEQTCAILELHITCNHRQQVRRRQRNRPSSSGYVLVCEYEDIVRFPYCTLLCVGSYYFYRTPLKNILRCFRWKGNIFVVGDCHARNRFCGELASWPETRK